MTALMRTRAQEKFFVFSKNPSLFMMFDIIRLNVRCLNGVIDE